MPKKARRLVSRNNEGPTCLFCLHDGSDEDHLGKLYLQGTVKAHYYCLLFSSALLQRGKTDDQGILGFMSKDIHQEVKRGRRLRCCFCKTSGATLGCYIKSCPRSYHLPCGLKNEVMLKFFGTFPSYCRDHRCHQKALEWKGEPVPTCSVCCEFVKPEVTSDTLYPPCCTNGWFHRDCLQKLALHMGYFFRCPLCNNQDIFKMEMLNFGLYIPERDASWELEPGAFNELNVRYSRCDAPDCQCPHGREWDQEDTESEWEIILCKSCASSGTHIGCSNLAISCPQWLCPVCVNVESQKKRPANKKLRRRQKTQISGRATRSSESALRKRMQHHPVSSPPESSCSSSPISVGNENDNPFLPHNRSVLCYRERRSSGSSSDASVHEPVLHAQRKHSMNSVNVKTEKTSPTFSLKRPAPISSNTPESTSSCVEKKPCLGNPFYSSTTMVKRNLMHAMTPAPHIKATMSEYRAHSGRVEIVDTSDEDDVLLMPVLTPVKVMERKAEVVLSSSSDSDCQKDTIYANDLQNIERFERLNKIECEISSASPSDSDKDTKEKVPALLDSESSSADEIVEKDQLRLLLSSSDSCDETEKGGTDNEYLLKQGTLQDRKCKQDTGSVTSGQLSILKFLQGNGKKLLANNHFVLGSKMLRKRVKHQKFSDSSLKITSFYHSENKNPGLTVLTYSDEDS